MADQQAPKNSEASSSGPTIPLAMPKPVWGCPHLDHFPRISIVTPNHNYAHFIESTLRSVLEQNYPDLEHIVIDDGSSDNSMEVIRRYADRLAHWETGPNRGQYKAITHGFSKATGDIFGWLNSDDMYFPWTLWVVADVFNRFPEVEWISTLKTGFWDWSGLCLGFEDNRGFSKEAFLDGYNLPAVAQPKTFIPAGYRTCIQQESTFWRRSLWEKAGGYVSHEFGSAGDFELWCRFYRHTDLHGVNAPLSGFRYQNQQQTSQMNKYAQYCLPALEQMRKDLHWSPSPARRLGYGVRPWSRPLLRKFKYNSIAYEGKRIARSNFNSPDAAWIKESHLFH